MMWFDRANSDVTFGDVRREVVTMTDRSHGRQDGTRTLRIEPDVQMDFRALPYADSTFALVTFDPPHVVRAGPRSWLAAKYGKLGPDWREDLRRGFVECLRVLTADGVLIFKWNETQVPVGDVLALAPIQPLFGHRSGRGGLTHWLVFMKPIECLTAIWKYPLILGQQGIEMPEAATILSAQMQGDEPQLWVQVKPHRAKATRRISVVGTGHDAPDDAKFIATFQTGAFVWHVFDSGYVTPSQ